MTHRIQGGFEPPKKMIKLAEPPKNQWSIDKNLLPMLFAYLDGQSLARVSCVDKYTYQSVSTYKSKIITKLFNDLFDIALNAIEDRPEFKIEIAEAFAPLVPERSLKLIEQCNSLVNRVERLTRIAKFLDREKAEKILTGAVDEFIQAELPDKLKNQYLDRMTVTLTPIFPLIAFRTASKIQNIYQRAWRLFQIAQIVEAKKAKPIFDIAIETAKSFPDKMNSISFLIDIAKALEPEAGEKLLNEQIKRVENTDELGLGIEILYGKIAEALAPRDPERAISYTNLITLLTQNKISPFIEIAKALWAQDNISAKYFFGRAIYLTKNSCITAILKRLTEIGIAYAELDPEKGKSVLLEAATYGDHYRDLEDVYIPLSKIDFEMAFNRICGWGNGRWGRAFRELIKLHPDKKKLIINKMIDGGFTFDHKLHAEIDLESAIESAQKKKEPRWRAQALFDIAKVILYKDPHLAIKLSHEAVACVNKIETLNAKITYLSRLAEAERIM